MPAGNYNTLANQGQASGNTSATNTLETQRGVVINTYTDQYGNVTSADVQIYGQKAILVNVPNSTKININKGAVVTVNALRGNPHAPQITGFGSAGSSAASSGAASASSQSNTVPPSPPANDGIPFLLWEIDPTGSTSDAIVEVPGVNIYFDDTLPTPSSGGNNNGQREIYMVRLKVTSLPPNGTVRPGLLVDLVDSYGNGLGMYRADPSVADGWAREDIGDLIITDGSTTVQGVREISFNGAIVSDLGNGVAEVMESGTGGGGVIIVTSLPTATLANRAQQYLLSGTPAGQGTTTKATTPAILFGGSPATALVAAFQFNEGTGTTTQEAANSQNGTLTSGVSWVAGDAGQALLYSGATNGVSFSDVDLPTGSSARELFIRFKTTTGSGNFLFAQGNPSTAPTNFATYLGSNVIVMTNLGPGSITGTTNLADGNWHTIAWTSPDCTTWTCYLDGNTSPEATGTFSVPCSIVANTTAYIGTDYRSPGSFSFQGDYDLLYYFNRQLTTGERAYLFANLYSVYAVPGTDDTLYISIRNAAGGYTMQQITLP